MFTTLEARAAGITSSKAPPAMAKCEYCGRELDHEGITLGGNEIIIWNQDPQRCDCEQAAEYWREYDEQQERERHAEAERNEHQRKLERINRLIGKSGIKKRFQSRTFDNFTLNAKNRAAFMTAREYAVNFKRHAENGEGLYIEGTFGTGKTHLAVAVAMYLMQRGIPCICKTSIDMLADIKHTYDKGDVTEQSVLRVYKDVDILVIDDLGKEQATEWSLATIYSILNDRYEEMKPTIITTNYPSDELIARMTPKGSGDTRSTGAIMSRLKGSSSVITMAWEDWRLKT